MKTRAWFVAIAAVLLFVSSSPASAQLAKAGSSGIVMGHLHFAVHDMEGHRRFWAALGGAPLQNGQLQLIQFPGVFVMLRQAEPTGGMVGSTVNHVGFVVQNLEASLARWRAAGVNVESTPRPGQAFLGAPDGVRVEILEDTSIDVPIRMDHVHFNVASPSEVQAWYVKTFGAVPGKRGQFDVAEMPGVTLIFSKADAAVAPTKGRALDHIGFEIADLAPFVNKLGTGGVTIDRPFRQLDNSKVTLAFAIDPWGTYIELNENLPPEGSERIAWKKR